MRRVTTLVAVVCISLTMAGIGDGAPVATTDPDDSTGALDVAELTHDHSETEITYTLETTDADPYAVSGSAPASASWVLDFDDDDTSDVCVLADLDDSATATANVLDGDCTSSTDAGDAAVTRSGNVFTVVVKRADLDAIDAVSGDPDDVYAYRVQTQSSPSAPDNVPDAPTDDPIEHELAAAPAASPTPVPSASLAPSATPLATDEGAEVLSGDDVSDDGVAVAGESIPLPQTGDVADTASQSWPQVTGMIVIVLGLLAGSAGAYKLVVRKPR